MNQTRTKFLDDSLCVVLRLLNHCLSGVSRLRESVVNRIDTPNEYLSARLLLYRMDWKLARQNIKATKKAIVRKRHEERRKGTV